MRLLSILAHNVLHKLHYHRKTFTSNLLSSMLLLTLHLLEYAHNCILKCINKLQERVYRLPFIRPKSAALKIEISSKNPSRNFHDGSLITILQYMTVTQSCKEIFFSISFIGVTDYYAGLFFHIVEPEYNQARWRVLLIFLVNYDGL